MVKWPPTRGWKGHIESPGASFLPKISPMMSSPSTHFPAQLHREIPHMTQQDITSKNEKHQFQSTGENHRFGWTWCLNEGQTKGNNKSATKNHQLEVEDINNLTQLHQLVSVTCSLYMFHFQTSFKTPPLCASCTPSAWPRTPSLAELGGLEKNGKMRRHGQNSTIPIASMYGCFRK